MVLVSGDPFLGFVLLTVAWVPYISQAGHICLRYICVNRGVPSLSQNTVLYGISPLFSLKGNLSFGNIHYQDDHLQDHHVWLVLYPFVLSTRREHKYRPIGKDGGAAGTPREMNQTLVVGAAQVRESFFAKKAAKVHVQAAEGTPGRKNQTSVGIKHKLQPRKRKMQVAS